VTDQKAILSALQRIESGEISPEEATELLLADHGTESLESIVKRLGTPPDDIVGKWCDQIRLIAIAHEAESNQPLPEIDIAQWAIDTGGKLLWQGRRFKVSDDAPPASQTSLDRIQSFRNRWIPDQPAGDDQPDPTDAAPQRPRFSTTARNFSIAGITLCIVLAGLVLFRASRLSPTSVAEQQGTQSGSRDPVTTIPANSNLDGPTTDQVPTKATDSASADDLIILETFESTSELDADGLENELSMSLDGLLPPIDGLASEEASEPSADNDSATQEKPTDSDQPTDSNLADAPLDDDEPAPKESPQQTRQSTVMAVPLGEIGNVDSIVSLSEHPLRGLSIDFPYDVSLEIKGEEPSWTVRDTRKDVSIAVIRSDASGTKLSWTETAKQSPNASALAHGKISDDGGGTIFLRPTIESDPWQFRFDRPDVMPTWNLEHLIPPRVSRLDVDFDLPDGIEFGWIEPVESSSLRRTHALAVITQEGEEDISLGVRLDIRCNRKLSCRIRFAARLDPLMNWQKVSTPLLEKFSSQLTDRANAVSNESTRLANVYSLLNRPASRRLIRAKQNRNKKLAEQVLTAAERLFILQTLIATLESQATISFRVWVDWPDTEQEILSAGRSL